MMMNNNTPTAVVLQYMRSGLDAKTALAQAAQQHPDIFPQQQVQFALSVLGRPANARQKLLENMARERGVNLKKYTAQMEAEIRKATNG